MAALRCGHLTFHGTLPPSQHCRWHHEVRASAKFDETKKRRANEHSFTRRFFMFYHYRAANNGHRE